MSTLSMDADFYLRFQHPDVRDLAFAIASPPMLQQWPDGYHATVIITWPDTAFWQQHAAAYAPRLAQLDRQPQALIEHLAQCTTRRLGTRFEALLRFWLQDHAYHPFKLLAHNVQQHNGTRTTGELDFVVRHQVTGALEHWEVALKFYLGEDDFSPAHWYGLNRRDTLDRKLQHFAQQQFTTAFFDDEPITLRRAILKGRVFWPSHLAPTQRPVWAWLNPDVVYGQWSDHLPTQTCLITSGVTTQGIWRRASRAEWITPRSVYHPIAVRFWSDGLYFYSTPNGEILTQHMCCLRNQFGRLLRF